jgi:beta-lactamase superfamily II metal-dependent hydrolase
LHRIGSHGGSSLSAATAVEDLISVAIDHGTNVWEVWPGTQRFGGAVTVLGPDEPYYDQLVARQVAGERPLAAARKALAQAARNLFDRVAQALGQEVSLAEQEVNARNNSSMITLFIVDGRRLLFTADAGVPALDRAWDIAAEHGLAGPVSFVQIPHHGSRGNASSAWLDRLLGSVGQEPSKMAMVSVVADSEDHPSGRVINAYLRRGCSILVTAGEHKYTFYGVGLREGWRVAQPLPPMIEEDDD